MLRAFGPPSVLLNYFQVPLRALVAGMLNLWSVDSSAVAALVLGVSSSPC